MYKPIDTHFESKGFTFTQVFREGYLAIYEQTWKGKKWFEVVRIQKHNGRTFPNGTVTPPAEFYPSANSWGVDGFTYHSFGEAMNRLEKMRKEK